MQKEQKRESPEESDLQEKNSVYDFLYHDVPRIRSFLSQLDPSGGYLTEFSLTDTDSTGSELSTTANLTGSANARAEIPCIVEGNFDASGNLGGSTSAKTGNENNFSRTYDPLWQNSLALLHYLEQRNLINKSIRNTRIGQFILVSGELFMFDIGFYQKLLQKPRSTQGFIKGYIGASENKKTANNEAHETLELFTSLPASTQARLMNEDYSSWSTLLNSGLSLSPDDLLLKHGSFVAGEWHMLGILDAFPDEVVGNLDYSFLPQFHKTFANYAKEIRPKFGRDPDSYGITPLIVFREVSGN